MTEHLPQFVIAERYVGTAWPAFGQQAEAIKKARAEYEQGLVELAQRREGRIEYQYSIPRKRRGMQRPGYFTPIKTSAAA